MVESDISKPEVSGNTPSDIKIECDSSVPPGEARLKGADSKEIGRIVNVGYAFEGDTVARVAQIRMEFEKYFGDRGWDMRKRGTIYPDYIDSRVEYLFTGWRAAIGAMEFREIKVCGLSPAEISRLHTWFESQAGRNFASFWEEAFNAGIETVKAVVVAQDLPDAEWDAFLKHWFMNTKVFKDALRSAGIKVVRA